MMMRPARYCCSVSLVAGATISVGVVVVGILDVVLLVVADSLEVYPVLLDKAVAVGSGSTNLQRPSYMSIIFTL
jgi:hypothetical protein